MKKELIELETKIAFMEQHINELSDVVYAQQKTIDELADNYKNLKEKILAQNNYEGVNDAIERPPHY